VGYGLVPKVGYTVDGENPAPPGMYKSLNSGIDYLSTGAGFLPSFAV